MLKKWTAFYSSLPPLYKKRLYQGIALYVLLTGATVGWVWRNAAETAQEWHSRIPSAESPVTTVFLTPQLTEGGQPDDFDAKPPTSTAESPEGKVSLIMTDMGLSAFSTERAIKDLPPEVTLAFSPYSPELPDWLEKAHQAKRETLILLPMEPYSYPKDDPGPKALLTRYSEKENTAPLTWALDKDPQALGLTNFMGSKFLGDKKSILPVFKHLRAKNKAFIEVSASGLAQATAPAAESGVSYAAADILIDNNADEKDIRQQLFALEKIARDKGTAIGVIQPYPVTFNAVKLWAETLEHRNVRLLPLSNMLQEKTKEQE